MRFNLRTSCGGVLLALSLGQGCGAPQPPAMGPNLVSNGSFESGLDGFEVEAENRWRTVSRLVLLPEPTDDVNARISVTTEDSTVYVDRVSFALAEVERGTPTRRRTTCCATAPSELDNLRTAP